MRPELNFSPAPALSGAASVVSTARIERAHSDRARSGSEGSPQGPFEILVVCGCRELGVAGLAGAVGDLLPEAGFFKTDFSFFDF